MKLRPYQEKCLHQLAERYRAGRRRLLVALPTGTGKTVVFARFPGFFRMKKRLLVLAHRQELLDQARDKFQRVDPGLSVEIEQAGRRASPDCSVVVASVPTLGRAGSGRLEALDPEDFYLIVVDEAHHAVAKTYRRIFDHFGLFDPDTRRLLVGFTATPYRGDKRGLGEVFEEIAYSRSLEEMIASRYLCSVGGWRVTSEVDLAGVTVRAGDFVESQLAARVNESSRNNLVVRAQEELAPGRRTLVFCVDVAHTRSVAACFEQAGVPAAAIWGAMPRPDREDALARFSRGEIQVVCNCYVLTEGFDEPRVDCIIMARPTKSRLLYAQMVGRGTRLHPDKRDLQVIDVVDNSHRHSLRGLHDLFNLPDHLNLRGHDALEVARSLRRLEARHPWVDLDRITSPEQIELAAERIDFFRFDPPEPIREITRFSWHSSPGGGFRLPLPRGEALEVVPTLLDRYEVRFVQPGEAPSDPRRAGRSRGAGGHAGPGDPAGPPGPGGPGGPAGPGASLHLVSIQEDVRMAIGAAERFLKRNRPDVLRLVDLTASWRDREPTESQLRILKDRDIPAPRGLTRGQASWMIGVSLGRGRAAGPGPGQGGRQR